MNIKEFNSLEEIEKYYDEKSNTYIFKENGTYIDLVVFNFDLKIRAKVGNSVTDLLKSFGCLDGMSQSNQMSLFG